MYKTFVMIGEGRGSYWSCCGKKSNGFERFDINIIFFPFNYYISVRRVCAIYRFYFVHNYHCTTMFSTVINLCIYANSTLVTPDIVFSVTHIIIITTNEPYAVCMQKKNVWRFFILRKQKKKNVISRFCSFN